MDLKFVKASSISGCSSSAARIKDACERLIMRNEEGDRVFSTNQRWRYFAEFILVVIPLAFWGMFTADNRYGHSFPKMHVYSTQSVIDNNPVFPGTYLKEERSSKDYFDSLEALDGDNKNNIGNMHLSKLQVAKYGAMCYGNREDHSNLRVAKYDEIFCQNKDVCASTPYYAAEQGKIRWVLSLLLEKWQMESQHRHNKDFFGDRSYCSCMDQMYLLNVDKDMINRTRHSLKQEMNAYLDQYETNSSDSPLYQYLRDSYFSYHNTDSTFYGSLSEHLDSMHLAIDSTLRSRLNAVMDEMRTPNIVLLQEDLDNTQQWNISWAQFCYMNSITPITIKNVGIMDSWLYICFGQALLLVSCIFSFQLSTSKWRTVQASPRTPWKDMKDSHEWSKPNSQVEKVEDTQANNNLHSGFYHLANSYAHRKWNNVIWSFLRVACLLGILVWAGLSLTKDITEYDGYNQPDRIIILPILVITIFFIIVIEATLYGYNWGKIFENEELNLEKTHYILRVRIGYTIIQDLLHICALAMISVGVSLQSGTQNFTSVLNVLGTVILVGFAQHLSNIMCIAFDWLASPHVKTRSYEVNIVNHLEAVQGGSRQLRHLLKRLCYVRLGVFVVVCGSAIILLGSVGVTKLNIEYLTIDHMNTVLFVVLYAILLCGYDAFYELLNMNFRYEGDNKRLKYSDKRWMHILIVYIYIVFVNFISTTSMGRSSTTK